MKNKKLFKNILLVQHYLLEQRTGGKVHTICLIKILSTNWNLIQIFRFLLVLFLNISYYGFQFEVMKSIFSVLGKVIIMNTKVIVINTRKAFSHVQRAVIVAFSFSEQTLGSKAVPVMGAWLPLVR